MNVTVVLGAGGFIGHHLVIDIEISGFMSKNNVQRNPKINLFNASS